MAPNATFLDYREAASLFSRFGVPAVPELYVGPSDHDAAVALAEGPSMVPDAGHVREGCVVRPIRQKVQFRFARMVLKMPKVPNTDDRKARSVRDVEFAPKTYR